MPITLYWTLISQPSRAVKCLLDIGKIQHSLEEVNLMGNQTRSPEYLSINPLGQIPFIIDGAFRLAESSAILVYLCEKYQQKIGSYYGQNQKERALVNQFLSTYQSIYRPALFKIIFLKIYKGLKRRKPIKQSQLQNAEKQMMNVVQELQNQLNHSKTTFLTGIRPTIADLIYFFETTNFTLYELTLERFPLVKSWFNRMLQIPEVKAITDEWQTVAPGMIDMFKKLPVAKDSKL